MFGQTNFLAEATARQIVQRVISIISHCVIGISGEPTEVRAYAELVKKMAAELMVEQMALLDQNQWEKCYREELANQLL